MKRKLTLLEQIQKIVSNEQFNKDYWKLKEMDTTEQNLYLLKEKRQKKVKTQYFELIED